MPLYYVNEHLIVEDNRGEGTWEKTGETYKRFMIKSAPGAMKREADGTFSPIDRVICTHNQSLDTTAKSRITTTIRENEVAEKRPPRVGVKTSTDTRYDTDVFVIALPYSGLIMPFAPKDPEALAIYKTLILKSDKMTIEHEDGKYMRCLYLVARPHHAHLDAAGEWYGDECNLVVTTIHSNKSKRDPVTPDTKWIVHTTTVRFGAYGKFEITSTDEEAPYDSINTEDFIHSTICVTVPPTVLADMNGTGNVAPRTFTTPSDNDAPRTSYRESYGKDSDYNNGGNNNGKKRRSTNNRRGR